LLFSQTDFLCPQVDLRHLEENSSKPTVDVGIDLTEFYMSVEWDILEVRSNQQLIEETKKNRRNQKTFLGIPTKK
jgi:hypothetical protein